MAKLTLNDVKLFDSDIKTISIGYKDFEVNFKRVPSNELILERLRLDDKYGDDETAKNLYFTEYLVINSVVEDDGSNVFTPEQFRAIADPQLVTSLTVAVARQYGDLEGEDAEKKSEAVPNSNG